jgi:hypothetical protein
MEVFQILPYELQLDIYNYYIENWVEQNYSKLFKDHLSHFRFCLDELENKWLYLCPKIDFLIEIEPDVKEWFSSARKGWKENDKPCKCRWCNKGKKKEKLKNKAKQKGGKNHSKNQKYWDD